MGFQLMVNWSEWSTKIQYKVESHNLRELDGTTFGGNTKKNPIESPNANLM
jgi:hypothetical protein